MKTLKQNYKGFLAIMAVTVTLMLASAGQSFADNWRYDHDGYWDGHHHYHAFQYYHHQRGYWDERNGIRIWINI
jgi:hypothetical protein